MTEAAGIPSRIELLYREGEKQVNETKPCSYFILHALLLVLRHSKTVIHTYTIHRSSTWPDISGEPFGGQKFIYE